MTTRAQYVAEKLKALPQFCSALRILSKEQGIVPLRLNGCQKFFLKEVYKALREDKHTIIVLKGRQQGISTVALALDLFWSFSFPGTQGSIIVNREETVNFFKGNLTSYLASLPKSWHFPAVKNNRTEIRFSNNSALNFMIASGRNSDSLGRGKGLSLVHGSEMAFWEASDEGVNSLFSALAENNPSRLYLLESTANGYNSFHDAYENAKDSVSKVAIFIPWYYKEDSVASGKVFEVYRGEPDAEESEWIADVKRSHQYEISEQQLAWWRWKMIEDNYSTEMMFQEYPPTEAYAFQTTGSLFFSNASLSRQYPLAKNTRADMFRYRFGYDVTDTVIEQAQGNGCQLKIFEHPSREKDAMYVIGADPAYGSSAESDAYCISVLRCYADKVVQVAEFREVRMNSAQFAWVLLHLCGYYGAAMYNLEMNGPGQAVYQELNKLVQYRSKFGDATVPGSGRRLSDVLGAVRSYLWKRVDSLGTGYALHFQTTTRTKSLVMNNLRSYIESDRLKVLSLDALSEMKTITQDGDSIEAEGAMKDDRVLAMGLALIAFEQQLLPLARKKMLIYDKEAFAESQAAPGSVESLEALNQRIMDNWFLGLSMRHAAATKRSRKGRG